MPNQPPRDLSPAEWKVMKIVWEEKKAMTREVYTIAGQLHGWAPVTVKTLLRRLVEKGYLTTTQVGNGFVYRPARTAIVALRGAADRLLSNAVSGSVGPLLAHMVDRSELTADELRELRRLIDEKAVSLDDEEVS